MRILRTLILVIPFFLGACGDHQWTRTSYEYQRTAGTGVAYVLAKMMPKKEIKLQPQMIEEPALEETKQILEEMEKTFSDAQMK